MRYGRLIVLTAQEVADREQRAFRAGLAIGVVLAVAVALLVWHRTRKHDLPMASRRRRIVETAGLWAMPYTAMRAHDFSAEMFGANGGLAMLVHAGLFMLLALLLIGAADMLLDVLHPRRTLLWLVAGPLLLAGFSVGLLAASQWMDIVSADPGRREFMLLAGVLIAGLAWWSRLPTWEGQAAEIFD